ADKYPPAASVPVSITVAYGEFATVALRLRQTGREAGHRTRLVQLGHQQLYDQSFLPRPRERALVDETRHLPEWLFSTHDVSTRFLERQPAVQGIASPLCHS